MREIRGRRGTLHTFLESDNIKKAFAQNIKDKKHSSGSAYNDGKSDKKGSLKWTLKQIYHEKCAFCESYIKNEVGDIEHFRPKNASKNQSKKCDKTYSYYWLAFSWDNLLPCCGRCNGLKSNCFDIEGNRIEYNNEELADLHNKLEAYAVKEKPKLLHPEYDRFEDDIRFTKYGEIESDNYRVNYTVNICDLNRENLNELREVIITDFINKLEQHLVSFFENQDIEYFRVTIKDFVKKSDIKYEYSLVYKYIKENFEQFLENINIDFQDEEFAKDIILIAFLEFGNDE